MKNILLIGLGRFGRHVAIHLNEMGYQVQKTDRVVFDGFGNDRVAIKP